MWADIFGPCPAELKHASSDRDTADVTSAADVQALIGQFTADLRHGVDELARLGYDAKLFQMMLAEHGAVEAARRLVSAPVPSYGLWRLKTLGRLDMSVEMWVLLPWYEPLFDQAIRTAAESKLRLLSVDVLAELARMVRRLRPE